MKAHREQVMRKMKAESLARPRDDGSAPRAAVCAGALTGGGAADTGSPRIIPLLPTLQHRQFGQTKVVDGYFTREEVAP